MDMIEELLMDMAKNENYQNKNILDIAYIGKLEEKDSLLIHVALPGVNVEDINMEFFNGYFILTVYQNNESTFIAKTSEISVKIDYSKITKCLDNDYYLIEEHDTDFYNGVLSLTLRKTKTPIKSYSFSN